MEFDVILVMDWLFRHFSKIDCYVGKSVEVSPLAISACQAKKCIVDGAIAYSLFVAEKAEETKVV